VNSEKWEKLQVIFETALGKLPEERDTFLKEACGTDVELYRELISLLAEDSNTHELLKGPVPDLLNLTESILQEDRQVGRYRIIRRLGTGGMGAVFLAERADGQFDQKVALKIIKPGMDSQEILKRFRHERQILAHLKHPSIAGLLDGGVTDRDLPYFTLEYVEGKPIDQYCDEKTLSIVERLKLFTKVCDAVQYAHGNLVIHRDLKPGNIMVTSDGQVKLLDFGIATLLSGDDNPEFTLLTEESRMVLTPEYASPEQVRGFPVSTLSDVYSLGIVLYELLCGQRPYQVKTRAPAEIEKIVGESEIRGPSTRISIKNNSFENFENLQTISEKRQTAPERLRRRLAGDLDNICLKALQKDTKYRYSSVELLQQDIQRHLAGLPISARPHTTRYKLQKFIKRHKSGVWISIIMAVIFGFLVLFYTVRLARERDLANLEARKVARIADFMTGIFEISQPEKSRGETVTARELLDRGANRIDQDLKDQPEVKAMMLDVVGDVYASLGLYERASDQLKKSLAIKKLVYGTKHEEVANTLNKLGSVFIYQRKDSLANAMLHRALSMQRELLGNSSPALEDTYNNLGWLYNETGDLDSAEIYYSKSMELYQKDPKANRKSFTILENNLALLLHEKGIYQQAEDLYHKALSNQIQLLGPDHPETATTRYNLSQLLWDVGRYEESERLAREVLAMDRKLLGNHHPDVAYSLTNLAKMLFSRGEYDSSEVMFREALSIRQESLGPNHPEVIFNLNELGNLDFMKEKYSEAEKLHRKALELSLQTWGTNHTEVARSYRLLGRALHARGKDQEAELCLKRSLEINRAALGDEHPYTAYAMMDIGSFLLDTGELQEARKFYQKAMDICASNFGEDHPVVASSLNRLAMVYQQLGRNDSAKTFYRKSIQICRNRLSPMNPDLSSPLIGLGSLYLKEGKPDSAQPLLQEGLEIREEKLPHHHWKTGLAESLLGESFLVLGRRKDAAPLIQEGYQILKEKRGSQDKYTRQAYDRVQMLKAPAR
jgi:serine/threonine protein kinase/Tfp pilus assembly protein PilF